MHFLACTLARIDGKSPVEYLDEPRRTLVRNFTVDAIDAADATWSDAIGRIRETLAKASPR